MIELYAGRGVGEGDAASAIASLSRYPSFFVDLMMTQELGMVPVREGQRGGERKEQGIGDRGVRGWSAGHW